MSIAATEPPKRLVLLGHPVSQSLSPVFQNAALKSAGLNITYDAVDVTPDALPKVLRDLARSSVGGNVTHPHKEIMAGACARLTTLAARVGAVNTFWHEKGKLIGDNTDVAGARAAIAHVLQANQPATSGATRIAPLTEAGMPLRVAILGAGGAAGAVIVALQSFAPTEMTIYTRTAARALALIERLGVAARVEDSARDAVRTAMLVINCTPVGLRDDELPLPVHLLAPAARVLDLIPRGGETAWVRAARQQGHVADDGTRMLVEQGATAFERWFDMVPDRASMWRALRAHAEAQHSARAQNAGSPPRAV